MFKTDFSISAIIKIFGDLIFVILCFLSNLTLCVFIIATIFLHKFAKIKHPPKFLVIWCCGKIENKKKKKHNYIMLIFFYFVDIFNATTALRDRRRVLLSH